MGRIFAYKVRTDARGTDNDDEKKKNKRRMIFAVVGIIIISIVMAAWVYDKYGTLYLSPGEKYTVNIPFIGASNNPVICGAAIDTRKNPVKDVNVTVKLYNKNETIAWNITDSKGKYCIYLPEITKTTRYDIYVGYNDSTNLTRGSNDYVLDLGTDKKNYSKGEVAGINGTISNDNVDIENGRVFVSLAHCSGIMNGTSCKDEFGQTKYWDYLYKDERYYLNIVKDKGMDIPSDEFNITFNTSDASIGGYKFILEFSFNAKEKTKTLYFNVE